MKAETILVRTNEIQDAIDKIARLTARNIQLERETAAQAKRIVELERDRACALGAMDAYKESERAALVQRDELRRQLEAVKEDSALLDAFDLAGRQDDVRAHQISEDECAPELIGHFWQTPTVQSASCREGIRAAIAATAPTQEGKS